jgi:hypothetical protein
MPDGRAGFGAFLLPADQVDSGAASQVLELPDLALNFDGFLLGPAQFDAVPLAHLEYGQLTGVSFSVTNPPTGFPYPSLMVTNGVIGGTATRISITLPGGEPPVPPPQIDTAAARNNYLQLVDRMNDLLQEIKPKVDEILAIQAEIIGLYNDLRNATTDFAKRVILARGAILVRDMQEKQAALRPLVAEYYQKLDEAYRLYRTLRAFLPSEEYAMLPLPPYYQVPPGVLPLPDA